MNILMSLLLCDRKAHYMLTPIPSMLAQQTQHNVTYYINIQTEDKSRWQPLVEMMEKSGKPFYIDYWNIESSWAKRPEYDQDQARLFYIVTARNMCIDAALDLKADKLQFVDSDMIIPSNTVERLASWIHYPMVGGFVRGRNEHKGASYIFGSIGGIKELDNGLTECDHGNIGFVMIDYKVFDKLRFRRGRHCTLGHLQSDDPNYCFDARMMWGFGRHVIDKSVQAEHVDDNVNQFRGGAQY